MGGLWSVTFSASPNSFACARKRRAEGPGAAALRWEGTAAPPRPSAARPFPRTLCRSTPRRRQTRRPSARRSARLRGAGRRLSGRGARRRRRREGTALRGVRRMLFHVRSLSAPRQAPRESAGSPRDRLVRPTNWAVTAEAPGQRPQGRLGRPTGPGSGSPQQRPAAAARRQRQQGRGWHSPTCSRSADTSCSALSSCAQVAAT